MKTIRKGVFETNSSSTHSISIQTIGSPVCKDVRPLVIDNILYPEHLADYSVHLDYGDGGYTLVCNTKDMKAALIAHWVESYYTDHDISEETFYEALDIIASRIGYDGVVFLDPPTWYSRFYPCDEDEGSYLSDDLHELEYLLGVVLDDTKEIVEAEIPH